MDKVLGMLGLAKRAGRVTSGEQLCEKAIKAGESKLILIARDCTPNTKKAITDCCLYYKVQFIEYGSKEELGQFTGSAYRAVVSVNDQNFAQAILQKYSAYQERNGDNIWQA